MHAGRSESGTQYSPDGSGSHSKPASHKASGTRSGRPAHASRPPGHLNPTAASRNRAAAPPQPAKAAGPPRAKAAPAHRPVPARPPLLIKSTRASRARKQVLEGSAGAERGAARRGSVERRPQSSGVGMLRGTAGASGRRRGALRDMLLCSSTRVPRCITSGQHHASASLTML